MTRHEWLKEAGKVWRETDRAGILPQTAAAAALDVLIDSWTMSVEDGISPTVLVHDLKEVAHALVLLHDELNKIVPNILEEMAEI